MLQGIAQSFLSKSGVTLLVVVKMHRKAVSVLKCLNVCYFKHAHVQTHSLYLGNISMAAKSISEKLGNVGIKAAHFNLLLSKGWRQDPERALFSPSPCLAVFAQCRPPHQRELLEKLQLAQMRFSMKMEDAPVQLPPVQPLQEMYSPALILEQLSS